MTTDTDTAIEVMKRLIQEAWDVAESIANKYHDEWCKTDQDVAMMTRLQAMYRRADTRYWRRVDALVDILPD